MIASISRTGVITVKPEDETEEYALSCWINKNKFKCKNLIVQGTIEDEFKGFSKRDN